MLARRAAEQLQRERINMLLSWEAGTCAGESKIRLPAALAYG